MNDGFARVASCGGFRMVNATLGIDAVMILVGAYLRVMGHESIHLRQFKPGLFCGGFDLAGVCFSNEWGNRGVPEWATR